MNFEELASPTPTLHPTKITNCVDTGPAAKMLIPKADRKAIHEVWPILTLFVAEEQQSWERGGDGTLGKLDVGIINKGKKTGADI